MPCRTAWTTWSSVPPVASARTASGQPCCCATSATSSSPRGPRQLGADQHATFIEHMARMHAAFWGWTDDIGLQPLTHRLYELSPLTGDVEAELGGTDAVPPLLRPGWERCCTRRRPPADSPGH